ncbi:hypothetical protein Bca52824_024613 [Brassica carinata]|uniref:DUF1985 domain-containing protein n=1 Tax=Brassica carinata TaxID=52824 RepID=A0A8X7VKU5_BRACI|nr:hypothetical protein Bca52824_024613 [Brassica carinata]
MPRVVGKIVIQLGYIAILAGFIEGRKFSTPIRASLAKLVMDLEKFENYPWGRVAFKVLIDSVKATNLEENSYTVDGFIQVLRCGCTTSRRIGSKFWESPTKQADSTAAGLQGWQRTPMF